MYDQDHPKLAHNALPIKDPDVISFIKQTDSQNQGIQVIYEIEKLH